MMYVTVNLPVSDTKSKGTRNNNNKNNNNNKIKLNMLLYVKQSTFIQ